MYNYINPYIKDSKVEVCRGRSIDIQLRKVVGGEGGEGRGDRSIVNLERRCEDIARITSDNVDPGGGVNRWSTWKGCTNTLQGLPLAMLNLGGSIDGQHGKDLQRHCKDYI